MSDHHPMTETQPGRPDFFDDASRGLSVLLRAFLEGSRVWVNLFWVFVVFSLLSVPFQLMSQMQYGSYLVNLRAGTDLGAADARFAFWSDFIARMLSGHGVEAFLQQVFFLLPLYVYIVTGATVLAAVIRSRRQVDPTRSGAASGQVHSVAPVQQTAETPGGPFGLSQNRMFVLVVVFFPLVLTAGTALFLPALIVTSVSFFVLAQKNSRIGLWLDSKLDEVKARQKAKRSKG